MNLPVRRGTVTRTAGAAPRRPGLDARPGTPYPVCVITTALMIQATEAPELTASNNGMFEIIYTILATIAHSTLFIEFSNLS